MCYEFEPNQTELLELSWGINFFLSQYKLYYTKLYIISMLYEWSLEVGRLAMYEYLIIFVSILLMLMYYPITIWRFNMSAPLQVNMSMWQQLKSIKLMVKTIYRLFVSFRASALDWPVSLPRVRRAERSLWSHTNWIQPGRAGYISLKSVIPEYYKKKTNYKYK